jgi:hypothetical protein
VADLSLLLEMQQLADEAGTAMLLSARLRRSWSACSDWSGGQSRPIG